MRVSIKDILDEYIGSRSEEIYSWEGFSYVEGDSAETSFLEVQVTLEEDFD